MVAFTPASFVDDRPPEEIRDQYTFKYLSDNFGVIANILDPYRWDFIPTQLFTEPIGTKQTPDWDTDKGGYLFNKNKSECLGISIALPYNWTPSETIYAYVCWEKKNAGAGQVVWQLDYQWIQHRRARTTMVSLQNSIPIDDTDSIDTMLITLFDLTDGAERLPGQIIYGSITRIGSHGDDTYNADARLISFRLMVQGRNQGLRLEELNELSETYLGPSPPQKIILP